MIVLCFRTFLCTLGVLYLYTHLCNTWSSFYKEDAEGKGCRCSLDAFGAQPPAGRAVISGPSAARLPLLTLAGCLPDVKKPLRDGRQFL